MVEDVAFPRMAFGHLPAPASVPHEIVAEFEAAYAAEFARYQPMLASELPDVISTASLWLAMVSFSSHYKLSFDESRAPFGGERGRRQLGTQWSELTHSPEPAVRALADEVLIALADAWSVDTIPTLPAYAAFDRQ